MVFPIAGGNESKGYEISNSLRFNDGDSPALSFTPSGNPTDADKFTLSCWIKLGNIGVSNEKIYDTGGTDDNNKFTLQFFGTNSTLMTANNSGVSTVTSAVLRDPSAWYHVVAAIDSQNSTTNDKHIIYINGTRAELGTNNLGSQSQVGAMTNGVAQFIGRNGVSTQDYFDGYMTEFHLVDGQQLAPTDFGEFDDNGVWIPKKYTGTYGTNGFFLEFKQTGTSQNSSGIGADTSGQDNHFAVSNLAATDVTTDTCTNNFATFNPLIRGAYTLSEGNCKITGGSSETIDNSGVATISMDSGKFYCEMKPTDVGGNPLFGIIEIDGWNQGSNSLAFNGYFYKKSGQKIPYAGSGGSNADYGSAISANDIVSLLYDADNGTLSFYLNGSSQGDAFTSIDTSKTWTFITWDNTTSGASVVEANFGNPAFAISSGNNDGKYGNFEYAVPSGYFSLNTKNLAEYG